MPTYWLTEGRAEDSGKKPREPLFYPLLGRGVPPSPQSTHLNIAAAVFRCPPFQLP